MISTHSASDEYLEAVMMRGRITVHREDFRDEAIVSIGLLDALFDPNGNCVLQMALH